MDLGLDGQGALYEQLARALKRAILEGRFAAGTHLPATRELARMLGLSRNTVLGAYELLCAEQLAVARGGSGTRVADLGPPRARTARLATTRPSRYAARARRLGAPTLGVTIARPRYNLQYGVPLLNPRLFNSWRIKLAAAALRTPPGYPPAAGLPALRAAICDYLARRRGFVCAPEDVVIVGGTQQALTLVARVVLDEGDTAVLEDPYYQYAMRALVAHGARVVTVPTDRDGLVTGQLPARPVRLVLVSPSHQFPSGVVMSLTRRIELLQATARHNSWIFEDDYDGEFRYGARPIAALRSLDGGERVIYVGTFSKSMFPSLRLGYIVCPRGLREDLLTAKHLDDGGCPAIDQAALAAFMQGRQFEKHLRESAAELNRRRCALLEGLARSVGPHIEMSESQAGMHVIVWFPRLSYAQLERLIQLGAARGLGLHAVHPHYRVPPPRPGLLVGFAGLSCAEIATATELLGRCVSELAPRA
ncbi:MAG TPA: PLP-dependent aminotransferase family protein [Steroidobacteraceae bacterium]|nr:PLP-dependent aminotransferase family protein [Steroidobacteraceae bacterium]